MSGDVYEWIAVSEDGQSKIIRCSLPSLYFELDFVPIAIIRKDW